MTPDSDPDLDPDPDADWATESYDHHPGEQAQADESYDRWRDLMDREQFQREYLGCWPPEPPDEPCGS